MATECINCPSHDCINCDVPAIEPEDCEDCIANCEESGIEYTSDFNYDTCQDIWLCSYCNKPV